MKQKEKKFIVEHFEDKCECREDDNCGCSFPNNTTSDFNASNSQQLVNTENIKNS